MSEINRAVRDAEGVDAGRAERPAGGEVPPCRIVVDKRTHRVRLENETESEVTVAIEKKVGKG